MKRIFILFLVAIFSYVVSAQEAKTDERNNSISISGGPISGWHSIIGIWVDLGETLTSKYGDSQKFGVYSFDYHYQLKKWLQLGARVIYEGSGSKMYDENIKENPDAVQIGYHTQNWVSAMLSVQFTYVNRPVVRVYSGVDCGLGAILMADNYHNGYYYETETGEHSQRQINYVFFPAFDITPIGVQIGRKVYGLAEVNLGWDSLIKIGIGAHF